MKFALVLSLCTSLLSHQVTANSCSMSYEFSQPDGTTKDKNGKSLPRHTNVWADTDKVMLFADTMNVNTDGTLRSYSVKDYWGESVALNNLCNASIDACSGLNTEQLKQRRIATQKASSDGWPPESIAKLKLSSEIIPFVKGKPCPEVDGFLVSATALKNPKISDVCNISRYLDSLTVNAVVLPRGVIPLATKEKTKPKRLPSEFEKRNAKVGDIAAVMSGDGTILAFAVVGDTGPSKELGEVSVALAKVLLNKPTLPLNYQEVRGRSPFKPTDSWTPGKTFIVVFPNTRDLASPYMDQKRIDEKGKEIFESWGGIDRLNDCRSSYIAR